MALIHCPECNKEISDKVKACPQCGFPLQEKQAEPISELAIIESQKSATQKKKIILGIIILLVAVGLIVGAVYYMSIAKPLKVYNEALGLLENGKYSEANILLESIPTYKDVPIIQEQLKYESRLYQCITSIRDALKNPDSLQIHEVTFYQGIKEGAAADDTIKKFAKWGEVEPICVFRYSGQNGYGGNNIGYALCTFTTDAQKYEFLGSCKSLDVEDMKLDSADEDELMESILAGTINLMSENFDSVGTVDLARVKRLIKNEAYGVVKILE